MPDAQDSKIANVDRLHAHMDRNNLAAVVARSGRNFTYLSGIAYPGTANDRTIRDGCARDAYDQTSVIPPS
jgi:Xaa-Pro aminopeptidase